jgi:hypothetical protein
VKHAQTPVGDVAELATFTVFSASSGKIYACGVTVGIAAAGPSTTADAPTSCSSCSCSTRGGRFPTRAGSQ